MVGTKGQVLTKQSETDGDANWEDIEANEVYIGKAEEAPSSAKIIVEDEDFGEGAGLSKAEIYLGADEPSCGEKVWLKKGKNIVESSLNYVNSYGVTANNNADGSVSVYGTSTAQIAYLINVKRIYASNIKNGMYTISFKNNKVVSALGIRLRKCSSSAKTEIYTTLLDKVNKSEKVNLQSLIDSDTLYIEMDIVLYKATNYNIKIYPQIEPGDETSYETYIEPQIYVRNINGAYEEFMKQEDTGWVDCDMVEGYTGLKARVYDKILYIVGNVNGQLTKDTYTKVASLPQKIKDAWEAPAFDTQFTNYCRGQNNSQTSITLTGTSGIIELCPTISGNWARVFLTLPNK